MDHSCTPQCRLIEHGDIITAAISKRSISDENLCSFLNYICANCQSVRDSSGRDALHVAASCGRLNLVKWLIEKRHASVDSKDDESGLTALHRSIFYGHINIAVELIKLGASLRKFDLDGFTALEHAMEDKPFPLGNQISHFLNLIKEEETNKCDLYAWGVNSNHTLGFQESKTVPEYWENFHKMLPGAHVANVSLNQFHSLVVTNLGEVYSCGHGQGGRLGLGFENTIVSPKLISFPPNLVEDFKCCMAFASRDHSLFLGVDGSVYSCGLNTHQVLGLGPDAPEKVLFPAHVKNLKNNKILGISAGQFHSVAWSKNQIFTWGLNAGQLGHKLSTKYISLPKRVRIGDDSTTFNVFYAAASDGATVFIADGDVYVLHEYKCRKIASKERKINTVCVVGGHLNIDLVDEGEFKKQELKIVTLSDSGYISVWQESDQKLRHCYFFNTRSISVIEHVFLNLNEILFTTSKLEAFKGSFKPRRLKSINNIHNNKEKNDDKKSDLHKIAEKDECVFIKVEKIPRIHRARSFYSDPKGKDFFIIQYPHNSFYLEPEVSNSTFKDDFVNLLDSEAENTADISFEVDQKVFKAHKYILASRSDIFKELFRFPKNNCIKLTNISKEQFRKLLDDFYGSLNICYKSSNGLVKNIDLDLIDFQPYYKLLLSKDSGKTFSFNLEAFPEYTDVRIKCTDGELRAHKCILYARVEYFNSLFSSRWSSNIDDITFPVSTTIAKDILTYIYTDSLPESDDVERVLKILILSDQLLMNRLKEICETILSQNIKPKNIPLLLKLAARYCAFQLKARCLEFICCNLAELLELQILETLDEELLKEVSETYMKMKADSRRQITPYSTAPSDEEILTISAAHPIDLDQDLIEKTPPKSSQKRRRPRTISTISNGEESTFDIHLETATKSHYNDNYNKENVNKSERNSGQDMDNSLRKRIEAINSGMVQVEKEKINEDYTNLNKSINEDDFPELMVHSPPKIYNHHSSNTPKSEGKIKMTKISQKERKRLLSEGNNNNITPISESPKNPWKVIQPSPVSPGTSPGSDSSLGIHAIVLNEKKQKENLVKITTKPLYLTQIEEAAIADLYKFYNVENVFEEDIEIKRVSIGDIATPTWVPSTKP